MYQKILGPLDGSKLAECSLNHIQSIATGCHVSQVVLLTVLEPMPALPYITSGQDIGRIAREQEKEAAQTRQKAEEYLAKTANDLKKDGVSVQTIVLPPTPNGAAEGIMDYANANQIDLIIMSTHGRSGISRWAFGSTADRVVRHAKTPVMTIAPPGCRSSQ